MTGVEKLPKEMNTRTSESRTEKIILSILVIATIFMPVILWGSLSLFDGHLYVDIMGILMMYFLSILTQWGWWLTLLAAIIIFLACVATFKFSKRIIVGAFFIFSLIASLLSLAGFHALDGME